MNEELTYVGRQVGTSFLPDPTATTRPRKLTVKGRRCNQLKLTWDEPEKTGGLPIINYKIKYGIDQGEITPVKDSPNRMTILQNLLPNTRYIITVRANNSIRSNANAVVNVTTEARSESEYYILYLHGTHYNY